MFPDLSAAVRRVLTDNSGEDAYAFFRDRALLTGTNAVVDKVNEHMLDDLDKTTHKTYFSTDSIDSSSPDEKALWPLDFLHSLTPTGMPPHALTLAPGALIILLRNIDADAGLCNGVRAIVIKACDRVLDVLLVSGTKAGTRAYIPRFELAPKNPDLPFILRRRQFPVKLAWCMTFNKAQGQTLKEVGIYLPAPVFSHGQLYVSLSRAGTSRAVKILVETTSAQGRHADSSGIPNGVYTDNVVWQEALLHTDSLEETLSTQPTRDKNTRLFHSDTQNVRYTEAMEQGGAMLDFPDEASGIPQTPLIETADAPVILHGADDIDEFGITSGAPLMSHVAMLGTLCYSYISSLA